MNTVPGPGKSSATMALRMPAVRPPCTTRRPNLVRAAKSLRLVPAWRTFDTVRDDMVEAVHRIASMAGKTANEPDDGPAVVDLALSEAVVSEDARPQDPERPPRP